MLGHDDDVDDRNSQSHGNYSHSHSSPLSQEPASPTTTNESVTYIGTDEKVDSTSAAIEPMGSVTSKERPASGSHDEKPPRRTSDEAVGDSTQIHGRNAVVSGANSGDDHAATAAAAMAAEYKVYKRRWIGLWSLTLLNIIVSWDWLTFSPVSQYAATYYSTNETVINWLSTAFLFAFVVICPVTVYILHYGPKPSIITAAVLILVGNWIRYAGSHSKDGGIFGVVMLGQIFTGLAQPFVLSAPTRYSDLWFTNKGRVAATALMSLANPFGAALGELIVPFMVYKPSDVSDMVLYVAIISTVCCLPAFFIPREPPTPPAPSCETPKEDLRISARKLWGSVEFWLVALPFGIYVGFFNSISSLLNQMMMPYGFSSNDAGIAGAVLIVVGLVTAAIASPILDRTKAFLLAIKILVPTLGVMYLVFIWMPGTRNDGGPYVILAIIGAASFTLLPVALEYLIELSHPTSPEVTSTIAWASGQLFGGCFILISNALKAGPDADPPANMSNALIFEAVISLACVPLPLCLGLFGRQDKVVMRRVQSDDEAFRPSGETSETAISAPV